MSVTSQTVKLTKGTRSLDLNSGRYRIGMDFSPPPVSFTSQYAGGSSHNRLGGASLVSRKAINRVIEFTINIAALSEAEAKRALTDVQTFLNWAGDPSDPVYLEYKGNSDTPEPLWGQYGVNLRYEIVDGSIAFPETYGQTDLRARNLVQCPVMLTIKPLAIGKKQRLASALGGISEDVIGTIDGISRGVVVSSIGTNLFTNPIFGHATYDNGWTAGGTLTITENTDGKFLLPGQASNAYIVSAGTADNTYTQVITPGTAGSAQVHTLWSIVKLQNAGTPGTADMQMCWNGTAQTTTFTTVGNGFWFAESAPGTATIGTVGTAGIEVKSGRHVYLCHSQMEQKAYKTAPIWGDLLGCAWTGTSHASTSTRAAGRTRITPADFAKSPAWTFRVVWKTADANTHADSMNFVDLRDAGHTTAPVVYFNATDDNIKCIYSGTSVSSSALTFSANTNYIIHATYDGTILGLYTNGTLAGTVAASFAPFGTYAYIGCSYSTGSQMNSTLMDISSFDVALTATQVTNDYNSIAELIEDDQRVAPVPWLWTKDGDDIVDNHDDSGHDNWAVCGGIPGSEAAETEFKITLDPDRTDSVWLGLHTDDYSDWRKTTDRFYIEGQGSVDATMSGGEYYQVTLATASPRISQSITVLSPSNVGGDLHYFLRGNCTTGAESVDIGYYINFNGCCLHDSDKTIALGTTAKWYHIGKLTFTKPDIIDADEETLEFGVNFGGDGTGTMQFDFAQIMNGYLCELSPQSTNLPGEGGAIADIDWVKLRGQSAIYSTSSFAPSIRGDIIEFVPDKSNTISIFLASDAGEHTITDTATLTHIKVIPRYALL